MNEDRLDELERELNEVIHAMYRQFQKDIEPYVKQLARIGMMRTAPIVFQSCGCECDMIPQKCFNCPKRPR